MSIDVPRGKHDDVIDEIIASLQAFEADHPQAKIDVYRQNSVSVRIRIIDPGFKTKSKSERHRHVWTYLDGLSEETQADISMLLLLAPNELKMSFANFEFDDPIPSTL
jgi:stress-induced morphogen